MPLIDMPMEELLTYKGRNPRPKDFDAYWDRALAEMNAVDPQVEVVPAEFQVPYAECSHLYFTGTGGARVHAQLVRPKNAAKPGPAVLFFHGYSGSAGDWSLKLPYAAMGFTVAALDCRGQGGLSEDTGGVSGYTFHGHIIRGLDGPPEKMLLRQIFLDTAQIAKIVMEMPEVDAKRVGALGGSQGGGLTLACAALAPGVRRAAPLFPFLTDYRRVWEMDLAKGAYAEIVDYFRRFDPRHEHEEEVFTRLGYVDVQHLASRIRGEVLMFVGLMDEICPPSTQFAAYNRIRSKKSLVVYPDFTHEGLPDSSDMTLEFMAKLAQ